jgi:DNA/RNA-binding domain of Phe-tRNA-synthetase-like protein
MLVVSERWRQAFPTACVGVLVMKDVANPRQHPELDRLKAALEQDLRERFKTPEDLKGNPTIECYRNYYKRFKKTYHVVQQVESVALKGKSIPRVSTLVEAMFMAELKNLLLTAGHDLDLVQLPVVLDVSQGTETYVRINGQAQELKAGDMIISDGEGIISSVIYGPDRRTMIAATTRNALFTTYAAPGIGEGPVFEHLEQIANTVRVVAPAARVETMSVCLAE